MAVHALADRATAGTRSCCRCCMHRHGHGIGDADLFNDQVGKIGKYRHRLILAQETVSLEILFGPLFYHIAIIEAAEEPIYTSQVIKWFLASSLANLPRNFTSASR